FGSFAATRTGLQVANGNYFGIIAADLQEPPEILLSFLETLTAGTADIVVGVREGRADPPVSRFLANLFWRVYRYLVTSEMPAGGVDIFACNSLVRGELLKLEESPSSLIGQIFWLGFRRTQIGYMRRPRAHGKSAWTFNKKIAYFLDSIFAFT